MNQKIEAIKKPEGLGQREPEVLTPIQFAADFARSTLKDMKGKFTH